MPGRLRDRPTGDLLILGIGSTICLIVVVAFIEVSLIALFRPEQDISGPAEAIASVVTTLIGVLAGFVAGRTEERRAPVGGESIEPDEPTVQ